MFISIKRIAKKIMSTQLVTKYKNIFAQGYVPHWSQNVFVITKIKNIILRICVIRDFKGAEIVEIFYEKELQKSNVMSYMPNGKIIIIHSILIVGLTKKIQLYKSELFSTFKAK